MPRTARIYSESGYMHIYTRGDGKQILFEQRADYIHYLQLLKKYSSEIGVKICAFCLMDNHIHIITYDKEQKLPQLMKALNSAYSSYFNLKYKRSGHVFESRYNSSPIESKSYLLTAFRYVLRNPQKAGICDASKYQWSSYNRYGFSESFVDTAIFQEMIGDREEYERFIAEDCEDCPELEGYGHDDRWAKSVIRDVLQVQSGIELQQYDAKSRDKALRLLKSRGLTIRQIERLTGINPVAIQNA